MTEKQKEQVRAIGDKFGLKLILVYGSYAKGTQTALSDLDIAVLEGKPLGFDVYPKLYGEFAKIFNFGDERQLHVQVLDRRDPLLTYHVAGDAKLLYGNSLDYHEFRAYAFRFYHDSRTFIELRKRLALRRQGRELEHPERLSDEVLLSFEESLSKDSYIRINS